MASYQHTCPCGEIYEDDDPDIYFCPVCIKKRKHIAQEVDRKLAGHVSKRTAKSQFQIYEEVEKKKGFVNINDIS